MEMNDLCKHVYLRVRDMNRAITRFSVTLGNVTIVMKYLKTKKKDHSLNIFYHKLRNSLKIPP